MPKFSADELQQISLLTDYMAGHTYFAKGQIAYLGANGKEIEAKMWKKLSKKLNNYGPLQLTADEWKSLWKKICSETRKINTKIKQKLTITGNASEIPILSDIQRQICDIFNDFGLDNEFCKEFGIENSETKTKGTNRQFEALFSAIKRQPFLDEHLDTTNIHPQWDHVVQQINPLGNSKTTEQWIKSYIGIRDKAILAQKQYLELGISFDNERWKSAIRLLKDIGAWSDDQYMRELSFKQNSSGIDRTDPDPQLQTATKTADTSYFSTYENNPKTKNSNWNKASAVNNYKSETQIKENSRKRKLPEKIKNEKEKTMTPYQLFLKNLEKENNSCTKSKNKKPNKLASQSNSKDSDDSSDVASSHDDSDEDDCAEKYSDDGHASYRNDIDDDIPVVSDESTAPSPPRSSSMLKPSFLPPRRIAPVLQPNNEKVEINAVEDKENKRFQQKSDHVFNVKLQKMNEEIFSKENLYVLKEEKYTKEPTLTSTMKNCSTQTLEELTKSKSEPRNLFKNDKNDELFTSNESENLESGSTNVVKNDKLIDLNESKNIKILDFGTKKESRENTSSIDVETCDLKSKPSEDNIKEVTYTTLLNNILNATKNITERKNEEICVQKQTLDKYFEPLGNLTQILKTLLTKSEEEVLIKKEKIEVLKNIHSSINSAANHLQELVRLQIQPQMQQTDTKKAQETLFFFPSGVLENVQNVEILPEAQTTNIRQFVASFEGN